MATRGFFGRVVDAGWHERAVELLAAGECHASAIDPHLLALIVRDAPALASGLRVIDVPGPSTIQPVGGVAPVAAVRASDAPADDLVPGRRPGRR